MCLSTHELPTNQEFNDKHVLADNLPRRLNPVIMYTVTTNAKPGRCFARNTCYTRIELSCQQSFHSCFYFVVTVGQPSESVPTPPVCPDHPGSLCAILIPFADQIIFDKLKMDRLLSGKLPAKQIKI